MNQQERIPQLFGSLVFNDRVMKQRLPHDTYKALKKLLESIFIKQDSRELPVINLKKLRGEK